MVVVLVAILAKVQNLVHHLRVLNLPEWVRVNLLNLQKILRVLRVLNLPEVQEIMASMLVVESLVENWY